MKKKSKTLLPKPSGKLHLSSYGYTLSNKKQTRRNSLKKASKKAGTLETLKLLNLIRNITKHDTKNKKILSEDVEYMKKLYAKEKKKKKA